MSWHLEYIELIRDQLRHNNGLELSMSGCGHEHLERLVAAAGNLTDASVEEESIAILKALVKTSYENMSAGNNSLIAWRRMYTDASIFIALGSLDPSHALESIAVLDRAIIIAGAAGEGRLDLIYTLIRRIQEEFFPIRIFEASSRPHPLDCGTVPLRTSSKDVPCLQSPPSLSFFQNKHSASPFVLRGYAQDWPSLSEHPWHSAEYLRAAGGPGRLVPVEVGQDYRTDDWAQKLMGWDEFLSSLYPDGHSSPEAQKNILYLAQHNLLLQFPALRSDIIVPDYVYASLPPPSDFPAYEPPRNDEQLVINAWLGPRGTLSPAHTDPYFNFFVQAVGRKTVWLAPPGISEHMYPYRAEHPAANNTSPSMSNTSRVDVFSNEESADHAAFWKHVVPEAMSVTLGPGDLLFFPPGWWHGMRGEDTSFSVSMWF